MMTPGADYVPKTLRDLAGMAWSFKTRNSPRIPGRSISRPQYNDGTPDELLDAVRDFVVMRGGQVIRRAEENLDVIIDGRSIRIVAACGKSFRKDTAPDPLTLIVCRHFKSFINQYCELTGLSKDDVFKLPNSIQQP